MALIACKDCSKEISTDANCCPNCGAKNLVRAKLKRSAILNLLGAIFLGYIVYEFGAGATNPSTPNISPKVMADYPQATSAKVAFNRCVIDSLRANEKLSTMSAKCYPNLANLLCHELGIPNAVEEILLNTKTAHCHKAIDQETKNLINIFGSSSQKAEWAKP